jgi:hypothetical protein
MLSDTITDKLISFKLRGFLEGYREQQESPQYRDLSFEERFAMLVDRERLRRQNLAFQKRVGAAQPAQAPCVPETGQQEAISPAVQPTIPQQFAPEQLPPPVTGPVNQDFPQTQALR